MDEFYIILSEKFSNSISTRSAVRAIFSSIEPVYDKIIVDFNGIDFISSSASHQFKLEADKLYSIGKELECVNASKNISRMLDLSKKDRKNIFTIKDITHHEITNMEDLEGLLLSD